MQPILEVEDLRVYFRTIFGDARCVDGVSFTVYEKEILGIAGESGCGKSTVVEAVLRLIKPPGYIEGGRVLFKGMDLLNLKEKELQKIRWKELSYVPQGSMNALNPVLKIEEQLIDGIRTHTKATREQAKKMAASALSAVGMPPEVADTYPHELSGGMRQRVSIGMSTSLRPDLILADEPITALDVIMQRLNLQTIAHLRDEFGITIVLVAHDMACHAEICDRICVMYAGKLLEIGLVDQIFGDPLHPYTQGLLEAVPSLEDKTTKSIPGLAPSPLNWPSGCRFHPRCFRRMEICDKKEPDLREIRPGRYVACFLYEDEGREE